MASQTNATSSWGPARTRTGMASPMSANCARIPLVRWVCAWRLLHRRCCPISAAWIRTASSLSRPPRGERPFSAHGYVSVCLRFPLRAALRDCVLSFSVDFLPILRRYRVKVPRPPCPHQIDTFRSPRGFFTRLGFLCGRETRPRNCENGDHGGTAGKLAALHPPSGDRRYWRGGPGALRGREPRATHRA